MLQGAILDFEMDGPAQPPQPPQEDKNLPHFPPPGSFQEPQGMLQPSGTPSVEFLA